MTASVGCVKSLGKDQIASPETFVGCVFWPLWPLRAVLALETDTELVCGDSQAAEWFLLLTKLEQRLESEQNKAAHSEELSAPYQPQVVVRPLQSAARHGEWEIRRRRAMQGSFGMNLPLAKLLCKSTVGSWLVRVFLV